MRASESASPLRCRGRPRDDSIHVLGRELGASGNSDGENGEMPADSNLLVSFVVVDQGSTAHVEVGILVCCTSAAASARPFIEPQLAEIGTAARFVVSDEPSAMIQHLLHHPGPIVIVVLKAAETPQAVVSSFVREFAMRRGGDERLLLRDWSRDDTTHAAIVLAALRSSVDALRRRIEPTQVPRHAPALGHPRGPLSDSSTFRAGESHDSWLVTPKPAPRSRPWRVWFGFTAAMLATVALVLAAHVVRLRGQKPRDPRAAKEAFVSRAIVAHVAAPGRTAEDPLSALSALEPWFRSGDIRLLDLKLGHFAAPVFEAAEDAERYCRALRFGVVADWRLAEPGELRRFEHARMLPAGRYWVASGSIGARIERQVVGPANPASGTRVVCVRSLGTVVAMP